MRKPTSGEKTKSTSDLFSLQSAARYIGVSTRRLRTLAREKRISCTYPRGHEEPLFPKESLDRYRRERQAIFQKRAAAPRRHPTPFAKANSRSPQHIARLIHLLDTTTFNIREIGTRFFRVSGNAVWLTCQDIQYDLAEREQRIRKEQGAKKLPRLLGAMPPAYRAVMRECRKQGLRFEPLFGKGEPSHVRRLTALIEGHTVHLRQIRFVWKDPRARNVRYAPVQITPGSISDDEFLVVRVTTSNRIGDWFVIPGKEAAKRTFVRLPCQEIVSNGAGQPTPSRSQWLKYKNKRGWRRLK